jgi:DNA-nicking Smr family endonuclease
MHKMNFGDILDTWEKTGGSRKNKTNIHAESVPQKPNPVNLWLHRYGVYDKDAEAESNGQTADAAEERRRLRQKRCDASLDIHGLTRDEAWLALTQFFNAAKNNGFEKVLVIHGKGNHSAGEAVLKRLVRDFIESCPAAGESGAEKAANGGSGATWVLIKHSG